jgi:hypothetical protein
MIVEQREHANYVSVNAQLVKKVDVNHVSIRVTSVMQSYALNVNAYVKRVSCVTREK